MHSAKLPTLETDHDALSCVIIPLAGLRLLLPNVCVAEIVPWRRIRELKQGPSWCLGFVGWRGQSVPVVHLGGFDGKVTKASAGRCLVIMNRSRHAVGPAFYAMASDGLPRMAQVTPEDLVEGDLSEGDSMSDVVEMSVKVGTEQMIIPDLGFVETQVRDLIDLT